MHDGFNCECITKSGSSHEASWGVISTCESAFHSEYKT